MGLQRITAKYIYFMCILERTDAISSEVLEPITFVVAYPTVHGITSLKPMMFSFIYGALRKGGGNRMLKETSLFAKLTKYWSSDQMKKNQMVGAMW